MKWLRVLLVVLAIPAVLAASAAILFAGAGGPSHPAYAGVGTTMTVTSAAADVGSDATAMLTLANIPADEMIGYHFSIAYNDVALTRAVGT